MAWQDWGNAGWSNYTPAQQQEPSRPNLEGSLLDTIGLVQVNGVWDTPQHFQDAFDYANLQKMYSDQPIEAPTQYFQSTNPYAPTSNYNASGYNVTSSIQDAVNKVKTANTTPFTGMTNMWGFPSSERDKYNQPIVYNGQLVSPPGDKSTTDDATWQAALDSIFGQRKTGWNTATTW